MANTQVLDALMSIFNAAHYQPLPLREITEQLQRRGFYRDLPYSRAGARVQSHLCFDRNDAYFPYLEFIVKGEQRWGLSTWLPPKRKRGQPPRPTPSIEPPSIGIQVQHTISLDGKELEQGRFPLRLERLVQYFQGMDDQQRNQSLIAVQCYGSEVFVCHIDYATSSLVGQALALWYNENNVQPGDTVWLSVEAMKPLLLKVYTEWDRDVDAYRRYIQRKQFEGLPRSDLSIRDLVWLFLNQTQQITHRSEIAKAVLESRSEVSERSVDGCLAANAYLFARADERGYWGLKDWGIEQISIVKPQKGENPLVPPDPGRPKITVSLGYVLETIHAEDLVYRVLQATRAPLSYSEIAERIANYLALDKKSLRHTSFLNMEDDRIRRLQDGKFMLRENIEAALIKLTAKKNMLQDSLDQMIADHAKEISHLKDELSATIAQHDTEIQSLRSESSQVEQALAEANIQIERVHKKHEEREQVFQENVGRLTAERDEARDIAKILYAQQNLSSESSNSYAKAITAYFSRPLAQIIIDVLRRRRPELPQ